LANLGQDTIIIADKAYDDDRWRAYIKARAATANIPNMIRRKKCFRCAKALYRERNRVKPFFNKVKQFRRIATRCDKLGGMREFGQMMRAFEGALSGLAPSCPRLWRW